MLVLFDTNIILDILENAILQQTDEGFFLI